MSTRVRWILVGVAVIVGLSSCVDLHSGLRARLAEFPAPSELVLSLEEERGPSSCSPGAGCPSVARYYLTEQALDVTCRTVRRAVDGWVSEPVVWNMEEDAFNACAGGVQMGGRGLSVGVFEADRLPVLTLTEIEPSELRGYRSVVGISMTAV